jgi:hypothetical protein
VVTTRPAPAEKGGVTTLGNVGDVSVEDRAVECLAAIGYAYEDAMDDLAFLARAWEASPPASVSVAKLIARAMSEPLVAAEPADAVAPVGSAEQAEPVAAVQPAVSADHLSAADLSADDLAVADLATATDLQVVTGAEVADAPADAPADSPADEDDEPQTGGVVEQVRALFAEAVTAEIPVQAAA